MENNSKSIRKSVVGKAAAKEETNGKSELEMKLEKAVKEPDVPEAVHTKSDAFMEFMERHKADFAMVVPKHLSPERVMRVAIAAARRNPELMSCWLPSVVGGCLEASALGLEINTPLHHAYLIPFKNNKTRRTEAQLIIGYEGYIELMYKHPKVFSVFFNVVHEKDTFRYSYGKEENIEHFEYEGKDRGAVTHFYAYAHIGENGFRFVVVPDSEAQRIRDEFSKSYQMNKTEGPWATDYVAMGCKTALRKLQKFVPKAAEVAQALEADFKVVDPFEAGYMPEGSSE